MNALALVSVSAERRHHCSTDFREPVRVVMHLNEGFTKVVLEKTIGTGMSDGGSYWDIPTNRIPPHLRAIGSRFLLVMRSLRSDPQDSVEALRAAAKDLTVEEISKPK